MLREVLDACLTKYQRANGLHLEEEDDHVIMLKQGEVTRAIFLQNVVTVETVRKEADKWVN